nr:molybdopterin-dependent oxidoreductase [Halalkalibacter wakoensis]
MLQATGVHPDAKEVLVEGYDKGKRTDMTSEYPFARSLPIDKALHPDTLIAYECNHEPIPFQHGFPLRLIVPNWYGMASVKWIKQISLIDSTFKGPYQSVDYMYYPHKQNEEDAFPVTTMNVNSTIQKPLDMDVLRTGTHLIKGIAWTGNGTIEKVEISVDHGQSWMEAAPQLNTDKNGWVQWSFQWTVTQPGEFTILSKATDTAGRTQPSTPFWNQKGYGYHAIDQISVKIEE